MRRSSRIFLLGSLITQTLKGSEILEISFGLTHLWGEALGFFYWAPLLHTLIIWAVWNNEKIMYSPKNIFLNHQKTWNYLNWGLWKSYQLWYKTLFWVVRSNPSLLPYIQFKRDYKPLQAAPSRSVIKSHSLKNNREHWLRIWIIQIFQYNGL